MSLSKSQNKLLNAIKKLKDREGMAPTVQELADELNVKAPSVHELLNRLEEKKVIKRSPRKARSIEILNDFESSKTPLRAIPLLAEVGSSKEHKTGEILIPAVIAKGDCFAMHGNRQEYFVIRRQALAEHRNIVLIKLNGKLLIRELYMQDDLIELRSKKEEELAIEVKPEDSFRILGKVIHCCSVENSLLSSQM